MSVSIGLGNKCASCDGDEAAARGGWLTVLVVCGSVFWASGCRQESAEPRLIPHKPLVRLADSSVRTGENVPPRIVKQIGEALEYYFGTPSEPRMFEPAKPEASEEAASEQSASEQDGDGAAEGETSQDGGAAPKPPKRVAQRPAAQLKRGLAVFTKRCAACHGASGDGEGQVAAYLYPRPRDYRLGVFKFTSTPYGAKPRRSDLIRTVLRGAKGTSMPSFPFLEEEDLQAVVDYVIMLSQRGEVQQLLLGEGDSFDPDNPEELFAADEIAAVVTQVADSWREAEHNEVIPLSPQPAYTEESITKGRDIFMREECFKCHGTDGRGRTGEPIGKDIWVGEDVYAADLSSGMLHGGRRPIDIYRRIYSGVNGTRMPAFKDKFKDDPDAVWRLVHFIISITEGRRFGS